MAAMTTKNSDDSTRAAKRAFFVSLFDLTWRLAGAMLLPIFIGLYIDSKTGEGKTYATIGFFVGMIAGAFVIRSIVQKIGKEADK